MAEKWIKLTRNTVVAGQVAEIGEEIKVAESLAIYMVQIKKAVIIDGPSGKKGGKVEKATSEPGEKATSEPGEKATSEPDEKATAPSKKGRPSKKDDPAENADKE